jgi:hypothetical protein
VHTGFWWRNLREGTHLEDPGLEGRIILKFIFEKWDGDMDLIDVTKYRKRWRALVNEVTNLRVP